MGVARLCSASSANAFRAEASALPASRYSNSNSLYIADGGRDLATGKHPRTNDQRTFDAAHELICNTTTTPDGKTASPPPPADKAKTRPKPALPQIFVGLTLDKLLGNNPAAMAEQIGLGLIPDTVLADYLNHGDIIAMLYDHHGEPLWLYRLKRHASMFQRFALIARDKACVLCNAPHPECDVHHLMPWNAPAKGETNLDQLALLCGPCHRKLHTNNHTLYRNNTNRQWQTRPATAHETPPKPVQQRQRE